MAALSMHEPSSSSTLVGACHGGAAAGTGPSPFQQTECVPCCRPPRCPLCWHHVLQEDLSVYAPDSETQQQIVMSVADRDAFNWG